VLSHTLAEADILLSALTHFLIMPAVVLFIILLIMPSVNMFYYNHLANTNSRYFTFRQRD